MGEIVGGMGKICYLCMLFPPSFIDVADGVGVSDSIKLSVTILTYFTNSNGGFRDNPVPGGNGGASHQRGHDLQGGA